MDGNIILLNLILWPMASAVICYLSGWKKTPYGSEGSTESETEMRVRKHFRDHLVIASIVLECVLYCMCIISASKAGSGLRIDGFCGLGIGFKFEGFRIIYVGVALLMWMMTALFSMEYFEHYRNRNRYYFFYLMTLGATLGVFMSEDLYTAFIFFEIMSFTSYTWVAHDEKPGAMKAAGTYLAVAVIGGLVMLMGLMLLYYCTGTLKIDELYPACHMILDNWNWGSGSPGMIYAAGICILFGFGAKAGMFPLHIWLPKAHPVAPAPASALLSGILTKSGVYGVLILCFEIFRGVKTWGIIMLVLGVLTMFIGAVLAVFSVDLKRTLACSSMSQIGFILTGCATSVFLNEENSLAAAGTVLYMVNHSIFKLVLFMCAGAVYMRLHKLDLNAIRGCGRKNPLLKVCFAAGALGIMGVPLFSGYISKTLIHEGIVEYMHELGGMAMVSIKAVEILFLLSGGMTIGYMIKLFIAIFVEKPSDEAVTEKVGKRFKLTSALALIVPSVIIVVCGSVPSLYIDKLSVFMSDITHAHKIEHISIFSLENLKGFVISLTLGLLVYLFIRKVLMKKENERKVYADCWPKVLDLEELIYRPALLKLLPGLFAGLFTRLKMTEPLSLFKKVPDLFAALFKALIRLTELIWNGTVKIGKVFGFIVSCFGESVIYSIKKLFFKELVEDKKNPILEKLYTRFDAGDRVLRIVEATISYSIIWLMLGLIGTLMFLIFY